MLDLQLIDGLPAGTVRRLAEHHFRLARELAARADLLEHDERQRRADRDRMRRHRERHGEIWKMVEAHKAVGLPHDQAIAATARTMQLERAGVELVWNREDARNHKRRRQQRDLEIMRLYRRGHSDAEIAERVDLHPRSVNRRIHEILAETERPQHGFLARWRAAAE